MGGLNIYKEKERQKGLEIKAQRKETQLQSGLYVIPKFISDLFLGDLKFKNSEIRAKWPANLSGLKDPQISRTLSSTTPIQYLFLIDLRYSIINFS